jgi:hypothetical protein
VIVIDSDVLVIEVRYPNDPRFAVNRQALQQIQADHFSLGISAHALLEVVGILSFNTSSANIVHLPGYLVHQYGLLVLPDPQQHPDYAGCTVQEVLLQVAQQMALGDAVQAVQIARHLAFADCLLTWNAKHFQGKLVIPVFTPQGLAKPATDRNALMRRMSSSAGFIRFSYPCRLDTDVGYGSGPMPDPD